MNIVSGKQNSQRKNKGKVLTKKNIKKKKTLTSKFPRSFYTTLLDEKVYFTNTVKP